jgi:patatin-like phospholipase/acyl hydrolase
MTFKILSLDGGGIRGVLSARLLQEVETTIRQTYKQELHEYFDLITGTSTGSIITAAIACQMKAQQMIDVYLKEGENIFLDSVRQQRK